jgi:hypothetical protein
MAKPMLVTRKFNNTWRQVAVGLQRNLYTEYAQKKFTFQNADENKCGVVLRISDPHQPVETFSKICFKWHGLRLPDVIFKYVLVSWHLILYTLYTFY